MIEFTVGRQGAARQAPDRKVRQVPAMPAVPVPVMLARPTDAAIDRIAPDGKDVVIDRHAYPNRNPVYDIGPSKVWIAWRAGRVNAAGRYP